KVKVGLRLIRRFRPLKLIKGSRFVFPCRFSKTMPASYESNTFDLSADGFTVLKNVYTPEECLQFSRELEDVLSNCSDAATSLRRANGAIYGARNLIALYPATKSLWQKPALIDFLSAVLGPDFGLVRGLYFDKPPQGNWSLPWHQDLTIAVVEHSL